MEKNEREREKVRKGEERLKMVIGGWYRGKDG